MAAIYGERLDRWLIALIVQRWVPDEFLDAAVSEDMAKQMKGIERLPDKPTPPST